MIERDMKPTNNMKNSTFAFIAGVNYDSFGMFKRTATNRIPVPKERKAGVAVVLATDPNGKVVRMPVRTKADREASRVVRKWLNPVTSAKVEAPARFTYTFVTKTLNTAEGKKRVKLCKLTSNKGVKKFFTTKKAATAWVKANG